MAAGWGELARWTVRFTPPRLTSRYARCFADPPPSKGRSRPSSTGYGEGEASALLSPTAPAGRAAAAIAAWRAVAAAAAAAPPSGPAAPLAPADAAVERAAP